MKNNMLLNFLITSTVVLIGLVIIDYKKTRKVDYMYLIFSVIFGVSLGTLILEVQDLVPAVCCIVAFHLTYQVGKDQGKKWLP